MRKLLCKVWRFLVGLMKTIIETVTDLLIDLTNAAFEILGVGLDGVGSLFKNPLMWLVAGAALLFLWPDDENETRIVT